MTHRRAVAHGFIRALVGSLFGMVRDGIAADWTIGRRAYLRLCDQAEGKR